MIAAETKQDPLEVRRKNFPQPSEFPYTTPTGVIYDSADYQKCLEKALKISNYTQLRKDQAAARKQGRYVGIGISTYVEICAMGPSIAMAGGGWESATVRIEPSGVVNVLTGASPHGQGQETSFAQIAADMFGISPQDVEITHGDTATVPYGIGTFGSRGTAVGGTAMYRALEKLRDKLAKIAAHALGAPPESLSFDDYKIYVKSDPAKSIEIWRCGMAQPTRRKLCRREWTRVSMSRTSSSRRISLSLRRAYLCGGSGRGDRANRIAKIFRRG